MKSLDLKLAAIHADPQGSKEFILADAKDADMAFGIAAPGPRLPSQPGRPWKSLEEYRAQIRDVIEQAVVDIVLMSASTCEALCLTERLFDQSPVTPAVRANDATDVFAFRGSTIPSAAARPFRTATIDHAQCGRADCSLDERRHGADLGLYSVTFNNDVELDLRTLEAYHAFRLEAERKQFRHFLEVFHPNAPGAVPAERVPAFINDVIARTLAGVTATGRPIFLKIPYPGPQALEELVAYDPHLVVGILGGSSGTTRDAFQMIHDARRHGARVALYGRKINHAESQLAFIEFLRLVVDGELDPVEAVRAYHGVLQKLKISPWRTLEDDLQVTDQSMSYAEAKSPGSNASVPDRTAPSPANSQRTGATEAPVSFAKMTSQQRLDYHLRRLRKL